MQHPVECRRGVFETLGDILPIAERSRTSADAVISVLYLLGAQLPHDRHYDADRPS